VDQDGDAALAEPSADLLGGGPVTAVMDDTGVVVGQPLQDGPPDASR
jgi:hypothetical protein